MPQSRPDDPREIAKWAKRYARSRTIPFLIQWVFIVALVVIIGVLLQLTLTAYRTHHTRLVWFGMAVVAITTATLTWVSAAKSGGERIWRISQWFYGKEGYAAYAGDDVAIKRLRSRWMPLAAVGLAAFHLVLTILIGLRRLPVEYLQPVSALYMVPFLSLMVISQRLGFWGWVWPALYALHAVALLTGFPIHFSGQWFAFDILVPIFGYGLISIVVGHIYSRYALRRLKALTRVNAAFQDFEE